MDKVSVIMPIYNVEKYLEKSIESLLAQTYSHLEVILVNDGSRDNSLAICQAYAAKDERIKVVDTINEGVAIARNKGIKAATGSYIAFVDPDDWVEPNMYEAMLKQIQKYDAEVCLCNFYRDTKRRSQEKKFDFDQEVLVENEIVEMIVNDMIGMEDLFSKYTYIMGSVWRGLYKKSFIDEHNLCFVPKVTVMEDLVFMVQTLLKCHTVAIDHGFRYHYVQHASSALRTYNEQMWAHQLMVYKELEKSIREAGLEQEMRNRLDYRYIGMIFAAIKNETFIKKEGDFKETILRMMDLFTDEKLHTVLERVKPIQVEEKIMKKKELKTKEF